MYLMYYDDEEGNRVYTMLVRCQSGVSVFRRCNAYQLCFATCRKQPQMVLQRSQLTQPDFPPTTNFPERD